MSLRTTIRTDIYSAAGNYTWNLFQGAKKVFVQIIAGGSGGIDGTVIAPGALTGPGGGQGGGYGEIELLATVMPSTVSLTVGAGGLHGSTYNGGGNSNFGKYLFVRGGGTSGLNGGGAGYPGVNVTATMQAASFTGGSFTTSGPSPRGGASGGQGGGFTNATTPIAPLIGFSIGPRGGVSNTTPGINDTGPFTPQVGGAPGAPNGSPGIGFDGVSPYGGSGGGGGLSSIAANGGNGGNGGFPGGGGGGGSIAFTGFIAGIGGNGADGIIVVTTYF